MCGFQRERQQATVFAFQNGLVPLLHFCRLLDGNGTNEVSWHRYVSEAVVLAACKGLGLPITFIKVHCESDETCTTISDADGEKETDEDFLMCIPLMFAQLLGHLVQLPRFKKLESEHHRCEVEAREKRREADNLTSNLERDERLWRSDPGEYDKPDEKVCSRKKRNAQRAASKWDDKAEKVLRDVRAYLFSDQDLSLYCRMVVEVGVGNGSEIAKKMAQTWSAEPAGTKLL